MPGVECSYGNITRLDLPLPFFFRDDPFHICTFGPTYNWKTNRQISILVKRNGSTFKEFSSPGHHGQNLVDIGGCPLECPFDPNENFEAAIKITEPKSVFPGLDFSLGRYGAIEFADCRTLVKRIYDEEDEVLHHLGLRQNNGKSQIAKPIYMACETNPESKGLVLIGLDKPRFLELRIMGPFNTGAEEMDLSVFLAYHQYLPNVVPAITQKLVHAIYEKNNPDNRVEGKVYMEFVWSNPKFVFDPPPVSARAKVAIKPKPGDANYCLKSLWAEVAAVETLILLRKSKVSEYGKEFFHQHHSVQNESKSSVVSGIQALIKLPSVPSLDFTGHDYSSCIITVLKRVLMAERSDVDFTDKAWAILKDATSIPEIWECFFHIFVNVEDKFWKPYLLPSNMTSFGKILKDLLSENLNNFRTILTPFLALDMTIEFGIQKLYRDYMFVLNMCYLTDPNDLIPYRPYLQSPLMSLDSLKKLHCLCEIVCLLMDTLSLTMQEQSSHVQFVLKHFHNNPLNWETTFHFDMPMAMMMPLTAGIRPIYWNFRLESHSPVRISRTNVILCRDLFVCHAKKHFPPDDQLKYFQYIHRIAQRNTPLP